MFAYHLNFKNIKSIKTNFNYFNFQEYVSIIITKSLKLFISFLTLAILFKINSVIQKIKKINNKLPVDANN